MRNPGKSSLKDAIRGWSADRRAELPKRAPDDNELRDLFAGRLNADQRAEVESHLVFDEETLWSALDLVAEETAESGETWAEPEPESTFERAALWRRIVDEVETGGDSKAPDQSVSQAESDPIAGSAEPPNRSWASWIAAGWLLTVIGLGIWISVLRHRLELLKEPAATVSLSSVSEDVGAKKVMALLSQAPATVRLLPEEIRERSTSDTPLIDKVAESGAIRLFLESTDFRPFESYSAELESKEGGVLAELPGLYRHPGGHFVLLLHPRGLDPGAYIMRIVGRLDGEDREIGAYKFDWKPLMSDGRFEP